jgi:hypothetical protein
VTLTSHAAYNTANNRHYLNAVVKNVPGAINTFKIDGVSYVSSFVPHPSDPQYAYAQIFLGTSTGTHTVTCDTLLTRLHMDLDKLNLTVILQVPTEGPLSICKHSKRLWYGKLSSRCKATPFKFAMTFPYQPTQIKWVFGTALNAFGLTDTTINSPYLILPG